MAADVQKQVMAYYQLLQSGVPAKDAFAQAFPNGIPTQQDRMKEAAKAQQKAGYGQIGGLLAGALGTKAVVDAVTGKPILGGAVSKIGGWLGGGGSGAGTTAATTGASTGATTAAELAGPYSSAALPGTAPGLAPEIPIGVSEYTGASTLPWANGGLGTLGGIGVVAGGTMLGAALGKQLMKLGNKLEPQSHYKRGYDETTDRSQIATQIRQAFPDATDDQINQIIQKAQEKRMITTPSVNIKTGETHAGSLAESDPWFGYRSVDEGPSVGGNPLMRGFIRSEHFDQSPDRNPYAMNADQIRSHFGGMMGGSPYQSGPVQFNPGGNMQAAMPPPQGPRTPAPPPMQAPQGQPTPMQIMQGQSNISPQLLEAQMKQNSKFGDQLLAALRGLQR